MDAKVIRPVNFKRNQFKVMKTKALLT